MNNEIRLSGKLARVFGQKPEAPGALSRSFWLALKGRAGKKPGAHHLACLNIRSPFVIADISVAPPITSSRQAM